MLLIKTLCDWQRGIPIALEAQHSSCVLQTSGKSQGGLAELDVLGAQLSAPAAVEEISAAWYELS